MKKAGFTVKLDLYPFSMLLRCDNKNIRTTANKLLSVNTGLSTNYTVLTFSVRTQTAGSLENIQVDYVITQLALHVLNWNS